MSASHKEEVLIKDACILFDLLDLSLLDLFYQLPLVVITTPEVLAEITDEEQLRQIEPFIENGQLEVDRFGLLDHITAITEANRGLSLADASALEAADRRNAGILSSDKTLRNESTRRGITVRGVLWVIEELFLGGLITLEEALAKLARYPEVNTRAPRSEIAELTSRLQSNDEDSDPV